MSCPSLRLIVVVVALVFGRTAFAAELGDVAAELDIARWVKGEPVKVAGGDSKIYVVEFWATWCPPCRESIPHLTEIQKRFRDKGVVVIGISDEKEETVKPFVQRMGAKMDYRVAIDAERKTGSHYMEAFGINGIPHSFVVRDKKIVWQGHPMAGLDKALEEMIAGKYDLEKAKARFKAESLYEQFQQAAAEGDTAKADELAEKVQATVKDGSFPGDSFDPLKEKKEIRKSALQQQFRSAVYQGDEKKAAELEKKIQEVDSSVDLAKLRDEVGVQKLAGKYMAAIAGQGSSADQKLGDELAGKLKNQPELANNIAWAILTEKAVIKRDVALALRMARQACEDSNWKKAHIIDTYARALFDSGKKEEAVTYEKKALAAAENNNKAMYQQTLDSYKQGKLPSEK